MSLNHRDFVLSRNIDDLTLSRMEIGDDLPQEFVRHGHGEGHDGDEQQGACILARLSEALVCGHFQREPRKVRVVVAALQDLRAYIGHGKTLDRSYLGGLVDALFDRRDIRELRLRLEDPWNDEDAFSPLRG